STFIDASLVDELASEVLGHLVAEQAILHPTHDEQVGGGDEDPVEDPVLGDPETARPVAHRYLDDSIAAHLQQGGDEAMKAAVQHEPAQALPAERAERTAAVLDGVLADPVA